MIKINGEQITINIPSEGSGCIVSDDGLFVLTAAHVIGDAVDANELIALLSAGALTPHIKNLYGKAISDRAASSADGRVHQLECEKKLNQHTFYRAHKFERDGVADYQDEIKVAAVHVYPKYRQSMQGPGILSRVKLWLGFGTTCTKATRQHAMDVSDFAILELSEAPVHLEDLDKVAFGMISHVTKPDQMQKVADEIKVGLWGYSLDKHITESAKKDTAHDSRATRFEDAKTHIFRFDKQNCLYFFFVFHGNGLYTRGECMEWVQSRRRETKAVQHECAVRASPPRGKLKRACVWFCLLV